MTTLYERLGMAALHRLDPETAHDLALKALAAGLVPLPGLVTSDRLATSVAGLALANPVGLAAGFDKNARAIPQLARAGFGFVEVGAATPRPQPGNPKPRLFRLTEDRGVINRFGFNNEGMEAIATRLARDAGRAQVPVGLNLGANKDSADRSGDFATVLARVAPHVAFATVNVSSPNTEKLRDLQGRAALSALLNRVMETRAGLARPLPVFLKIAPDLTGDEVEEIAEVAVATGVDAIIATNTTLARDGLTSAHRGEAGGLSGAPLFEKSTRLLARLSVALDGRLPVIGVGGIATADQAYEKLRAGASAVQMYSALVFGGLSVAAGVVRGLDARLAREGRTVAEVTGTGRGDWL
ncbi:quinone-dependent dihydroorotate dehydrogenase [Frigidibacter sp. MR17.24]|uniref:quinone-dependent dihydroorotate dehydrogenase n=1 Tax=Frigidibacter sp. MR17.24 TaxID=3127345 RepID=UPI003012DC1E